MYALRLGRHVSSEIIIVQLLWASPLIDITNLVIVITLSNGQFHFHLKQSSSLVLTQS